jgi:hypothetical protein
MLPFLDVLRSLLSDVSPSSATDHAPDPSDRKGVLLHRIEKYNGRRRRNWRTRRWLQIIGVILLVVSFIVYGFGISLEKQHRSLILAAGVLVAIAMWASSFAFTPYEFELEIRQTEDELDLIDTEASKDEQDAQKLFKLHQLELNKYYDQTLKQSRWIFFVGLFSLVLGFGVIGITVWVVRDGKNGSTYSVAILGGIGGILSNFIGAVYLKMHSETIKSLTEFHNRLVRTHYLHFGNFLLAKIETRGLREQSLAKMAINLSTNEKHTPNKATTRAPRTQRTSNSGKQSI